MGVSWLKQGAKGWSFIPLPQNPYYTVVDFKLLWQQAVLYILFLLIIYTLFYKPSLACLKRDKMVLYFGEVNHECDAGGILKIFYVHK